MNTYYAVLDETDFHPDVIWMVTEPSFEDNMNELGDGFEVISTGFDLKPVIRSFVLPEADIGAAGIEIGGLVNTFGEEDIIALDITSARKALVAGALLATVDNKPEHIFYLQIDNVEDISKPYIMIPLQYQQLHDFREETRRPPR